MKDTKSIVNFVILRALCDLIKTEIQ